MNLLMTLVFLSFIGLVLGWVLKLFFRRFISLANPERKWINPGFCTEPWLPLYGSGLCSLFLIANLENTTFITDLVWGRAALFAAMAVCMTAIKYIAGIHSLTVAHVRLWDYSQEWGNIQGIIRPKFSFFIGMFYGVFIMDLCHSAQVVTKLKVFADENDVIIKYESLKSHIRAAQDQDAQKYHFFCPFQAAGGLHEHLQDHLKKMEDAVKENRDLVF